MRLFLAINPPLEVRRAAWDVTAPLRDTAAGVAWVPEHKIHLTLKFLGEQAESAVPRLVDLLTRLGQSHAPPLIRINGAGAFPNFRQPHVVWLSVDPEPRLELLQHDVEVAAASLGYELDGRPFRPHLTIGRVKGTLTATERRVLRTGAGKVRFTHEFFVSSLDLMQSIPDPTGSRYAVLATAPMRGS